MKKILIISLIIALFLISGCSKTQKCWEREITYTEMEKVTNEVCRQKEVNFEITIIDSKIDPKPNQAAREYDVGTMRFAVLNKEEKLSGDFDVFVEFDTTKLGLVKESKTINLQAGERKEITLMHNGRNSGAILSIKDPVVVFESGEEICEEITEEIPVEKTRKETVCE